MAEHISKQFDMELETIRTRVLQMGGLVEQQILSAVEALLAGDIDKLDKVIAEDALVNAMEVTIDDDCLHIIARRQPAASDLRIVFTVIKVITDLERIGDEAKKIARMGKTIYQSERYQMPRFREIEKMADSALSMLRRALDAFARLDTSAALELAEADQELDEDFAAELRQLITFMMEDPRTISMSIDTLFISKAIERIGDHATNISEYVVYLVKGKDIRHTTLETKKRETLG
ncbi:MULTISPECIES: phosphate signaling complex protein PhoU [Chromobacterium]|uniref:Phosphate-specific transport system accessory protein PhoU n=2 Tax=Chromobacterium TaxID=535 RepID=A0ABS3GTY0_9NEIS|nr:MULTISPECIES: phosphate signaling complex protein PhoU [Chromobacterium]AXT47821.1 phosphate transport system regulatory protein PhoU [Chromobacterium rhizoryzae]MBK0416777.1 phosphate signaling complex protein PhoU [Chromobacterium haemolyticum]MBO0418025.1 phosphate signaling complex protein PhoU [Chromobacterium haemolyticum]MBO0501164.1 phosphate signaling complex protein PhoU [Chromobacterium haemolyticum]MDH0341155.1 phosphate signaling complex protein PhoU [Chromobacterium haemolytic